jgi:hypothetical protein
MLLDAIVNIYFWYGSNEGDARGDGLPGLNGMLEGRKKGMMGTASTAPLFHHSTIPSSRHRCIWRRVSAGSGDDYEGRSTSTNSAITMTSSSCTPASRMGWNSGFTGSRTISVCRHSPVASPSLVLRYFFTV